MSGLDALPSDAPSRCRPLFVGRRAGQVVSFVCAHDGSFGIWCGDACLSVWAATELDEALRAYLGLVDGRHSWAVTVPSDDRGAPGDETSSAA